MSERRHHHLLRVALSIVLLAVAMVPAACTHAPEGGADSQITEQLAAAVSPLGARNWIVIAEASFPVYAGTGVETISVDAPSDVVFMEVLDILESEGRLQPRIWVSSELDSVTEDYAPGIRKYRRALGKLLPGRFHYRLASHIINKQVEKAIRTFRVLVIKTNTTLPYSNVCIELDSGYWNADSEAELRARIEQVRQDEERENAVPTLHPALPGAPAGTPGTAVPSAPRPAAPAGVPAAAPAVAPSSTAVPAPGVPGSVPGAATPSVPKGPRTA